MGKMLKGGKEKMKKYNKKGKKQEGRVLKFLETVILTILIISFAVLIYCIYVSLGIDDSAKSSGDYETKKLSAEIEKKTEVTESDISEMIERVNKSIVGISKIKNKGSTIFMEDSVSDLGLGTGFIVSENGYIVTNAHVSGNKYSNCYVTLENGKSYTADVVWADADVDISVIKINVGGLECLELGDSDNIKIAQKVYAIGNPIGFEFQRSVTSGIISGLDRTLKLEENEEDYYMEDLIQTDATINPGNSGGPLIDDTGKVIGINSVKITSAEGIGFALPINIIKPIVEKLKTTGEYKTATLGVFAYDKNVIPYINQDLGISQNLDSGIYIAEIVKNSPASNAGLKEGDVILKIDEKELKKMSELRAYIYSKSPGDKVTIEYLRNNKKLQVEVVLVKK